MICEFAQPRSIIIINFLLNVLLFSQFYVLNVYDGSEPLSEGEIAAQLEKIINNSDPEPSEEAVGILTGAERTFWAKQRKRMLKGNLL